MKGKIMFERYTVQSYFDGMHSPFPSYRLFDELHDSPGPTGYATLDEAQRVADESNRAYDEFMAD